MSKIFRQNYIAYRKLESSKLKNTKFCHQLKSHLEATHKLYEHLDSNF